MRVTLVLTLSFEGLRGDTTRRKQTEGEISVGTVGHVVTKAAAWIKLS